MVPRAGGGGGVGVYVCVCARPATHVRNYRGDLSKIDPRKISSPLCDDKAIRVAPIGITKDKLSRC